MPRERMAGANPHEGFMEVAFEQWTEQRRKFRTFSLLVGFNVFPALKEAVSEFCIWIMENSCTGRVQK